MNAPTTESTLAGQAVVVVLPSRSPGVASPPAWRRPLLAAALIGVAYFLARPAAVVPPEVDAFAFAPPVKMPGGEGRAVRILHGDYAPNSGWISSVGAAASLGDLANTG